MTFIARRRLFACWIPALPEIQSVAQTNYTDIGFALDRDGTRMIIVSALDNLIKGAAGQAIQNMNLMFGFDEGTALTVKIVIKVGGQSAEEQARRQTSGGADHPIAAGRPSRGGGARRRQGADRNPPTAWGSRRSSTTACASPTPQRATWL